MSSPFLSQTHLRKSPSRASSSFAYDAISLRRPRSSGIGPSFICTICWQPQYPSINDASSSSFGPKLLGASARIVCRACWCAVLDLSICWVCGECIVRGDGVVSLGWCFWHRGCFGCLVCGTRMSIPNQYDTSCEKNRGESWEGNDEIEGEKRKRKSCLGVELEEIPLCSVCRIETAGESQGEVLERGLETVSSFDGGLSRDRLDSLSEERAGMVEHAPRTLVRAPRRLRGATGIESELKRFINSSSTGSTRPQVSESVCSDDQNPLLLGAADMSTSEDDTADGHQSHTNRETANVEEPSLEPAEVYVSVYDPVGEPAFKPSLMKPLPKWMSLLPSNIQSGRDRQRALHSETSNKPTNELHSPEGSCESFSSDTSGSYDQPPSSGLPASRGLTMKSEGTSPPIDITKQERRVRTICFKGEELGNPDIRSSRRSQLFESTLSTPLEFPAKSIALRHPTPFPRIPRPRLERSDSTSYFSHNVNSSARPELVNESPSNEVLQSHTPDNGSTKCTRQIKFPTPSAPRPSSLSTHSSEYLDRYHPRTSDHQHQKYIAKQPEPIIEKIKRQRVGNKNIGRIAVEAREKRWSIDRVSLEDGEHVLDPRRVGLKKELRKLFCEE